MTKIYLNWEENDTTWDSEVRLWEEVYYIIEELIEGGRRNPEEWGDMPYQQEERNAALREKLQQDLDRLSEEKKEKLIEVLVTIDGKKYENKKLVKNKKDIKITVDDVKLIANNYLNIEIEFLK